MTTKESKCGNSSGTCSKGTTITTPQKSPWNDSLKIEIKCLSEKIGYMPSFIDLFTTEMK